MDEHEQGYTFHFIWRCLIVLCTLSCHAHFNEVQADRPPNVIIFYADDLGWMDLGIQGSPYYETPNNDAIGMSGMRFANAYANAANCAPSRACLMTGLYAPRHGIYTVGNSDRGDKSKRRLVPIKNQTLLDTSFMNLPRFFQERGYRTCIAGKWHLSQDPTEYGFDENYGGNQQGHPRSYFAPYRNPTLVDGPKDEYLTDRLAEEVKGFIRRHHTQPYFTYVPFYSVHTPIQPRPDLVGKYEQKEKARHSRLPNSNY